MTVNTGHSETLHWYVSVGEPAAVTVKVAVWPALTVTL
jgi:hypothetical protein